MADEWTPSEHVRALRGYLERVRDGEDPIPRSGAWVALDHLEALASSPLPAGPEHAMERDALRMQLKEATDTIVRLQARLDGD